MLWFKTVVFLLRPAETVVADFSKSGSTFDWHSPRHAVAADHIFQRPTLTAAQPATQPSWSRTWASVIWITGDPTPKQPLHSTAGFRRSTGLASLEKLKRFWRSIRHGCPKTPETNNGKKNGDNGKKKERHRKIESMLSNKLNCLALWHQTRPFWLAFFGTTSQSLITQYWPVADRSNRSYWWSWRMNLQSWFVCTFGVSVRHPHPDLKVKSPNL